MISAAGSRQRTDDIGRRPDVGGQNFEFRISNFELRI
jgi:hypothetical protein